MMGRLFCPSIAFSMAVPEVLSSTLEILASSDAVAPGLREPVAGADATPLQSRLIPLPDGFDL
jgi:hypothetical protein